MPNIRGSAPEVKVDPTTDREGVEPGVGKAIEVIKICGILYCSCNVVMACFKLSISTIFTPDKVLMRSVISFVPEPQVKQLTLPRIDSVVSDPHP